MTWITEPVGYANPAYYLDSADPSERQLRADFAKCYQLREIAPFGETPAATAEMTQHADELATRWEHHQSPGHRRMWETLHAAVTAWEARPEHARRNFDHITRARTTGDIAVEDSLWRTLQQARAITGHGTDLAADSTLDQVRRYPNLDPGPALANHTQHAIDTDSRTAVERTLGAPRDRSADVNSLDDIRDIITATNTALEAQEDAGNLDTGREARRMLLPRAVRDAPIAYNYTQSEVWELRHAALLREVQDLACEHTSVADAFNGHDDQHRIARLESLRNGLAEARRDAVRAGVPKSDVDRAYILGRDGIYWSTEPSHPRLGHIAQLSEERDRARAETTAILSDTTTHPANPALDNTPQVGIETNSGRGHFGDPIARSTTEGGARIVEAIDAVLAEVEVDNWSESTTAPPQPTPSSIENVPGVHS